MVADNQSFVLGVIAGVVFMVIVGRFSRQHTLKRFGSKKATRNVIVRGDETARQIVTQSVRDGACATFYLLVVLFLFVVLGMFLYWLWWH